MRQVVMSSALLLAVLMGAHVAHAQLRLPNVQLPNAGPVTLPLDVSLDGRLDGMPLNVDRLRDLRHTQIQNLIRTHRDVLEADPAGEAIVRQEVLAYSPSPTALASARALGFTVTREDALEGLDATIVTLQVPARMSTARALRALRGGDPSGTYDFNHVYSGSGEVRAVDAAAPRPGSSEIAIRVGTRVALIDAGVDTTHPAFRHARVHRWGCADRIVPSEHGTAVASLLMGDSPELHGAAPNAELYAADVYCGSPTGGSVDAIAGAFAWIARERVPVINVSLVGPKNIALEQIIRSVIARGHVVVAAVGNDGPAAPPLYPAAFANVIAVTAVDAHERVLLEACRGPHVMFAAPGADMRAAHGLDAYADVRGTSFAAPIVAGLLAQQMDAPAVSAARKAVSQLINQAKDLGSKGRDPIYGYGLVSLPSRRP